tara:strand:- start:116 stop:883 length:768 start_codon:yes stop_codon:yes gene_type:complete
MKDLQILFKLNHFYRKFGVLGLVKKVISALLYRIKTKIFTFKLVRSKLSNKEKFTAIFYKTLSESTESVSGVGSSLEYTSNLRKKLPYMFAQFKIKSVFDAPCGDFNWMKEVILTNDISYLGTDIVSEIVNQNISNYSAKNISFFEGDLTKISFPKSDLMILRDILFHLSYNDARKVIHNFLKSEIKFLLTTTHTQCNQNSDIYSGDFKFINLYKHPYNFPNKPLWVVDDWIPPFPQRKMVLFSREQLIENKVFE